MSPEDPQPLASDAARMLEIGMALWGVALVVCLLVPSLHQGDRGWWPWTCVMGMAGGGLALLYVRRGRGNAEGAHLPARSPHPTERPPNTP
ncbi:MAG TPA: DUF2530 domain-containing protein [Dermatophilaceae bacterium]|nr:DUF2530 domain-containing protein [Dermatophilaceae bacterium]